MSPCADALIIKYKLSVASCLPCDLIPSAPTVAAARQHFQRTINTLVGRGGQGYREDTEVGNPLDGMPGDAVIPHLKKLVGQKQAGSEEALRIAELARDVALKHVSAPGLPDIQRWGKVLCCLLRCSLEAVDP